VDGEKLLDDIERLKAATLTTLIQDPVERPVRLVAATQWFPVGTPEELAKAEKILDNI
jgi:NDP-sugar pyrophosphorylase family protein